MSDPTLDKLYLNNYQARMFRILVRAVTSQQNQGEVETHYLFSLNIHIFLHLSVILGSIGVHELPSKRRDYLTRTWNLWFSEVSTFPIFIRVTIFLFYLFIFLNNFKSMEFYLTNGDVPSARLLSLAGII